MNFVISWTSSVVLSLFFSLHGVTVGGYLTHADATNRGSGVRLALEGDQPRVVTQIHMAQGKDPTSMTISWITPLVTAPTTCCGEVPIISASEVHYGTSPDAMGTKGRGYSQYYTFNMPGAANYTSGLIHHVTLTDLKPGSHNP